MLNLPWVFEALQNPWMLQFTADVALLHVVNILHKLKVDMVVPNKLKIQ